VVGVGRVACDEFGFSRRKHLEKKNLKVKNLEKENLEKENGEGKSGEGSVDGRIDGRLDWRWRSGVGSDVSGWDGLPIHGVVREVREFLGHSVGHGRKKLDGKLVGKQLERRGDKCPMCLAGSPRRRRGGLGNGLPVHGVIRGGLFGNSSSRLE
jgi:hypothetical protein